MPLRKVPSLAPSFPAAACYTAFSRVFWYTCPVAVRNFKTLWCPPVGSHWSSSPSISFLSLFSGSVPVRLLKCTTGIPMPISMKLRKRCNWEGIY
ncbi:hypothetical protein K469DRAFT_365791 [Zopfia rhizophila CBS 207.26]|uniref:Uncharacterized protein n=1 Tax=Zopfia rhizophila CBS 207.26 TaxID=1314779 RepID=A0A6A6EK76_9PEZI|nr:hypothetical protein K469DRAFT_365791 [Zopfia rhizophila CBS 207.26]